MQSVNRVIRRIWVWVFIGVAAMAQGSDRIGEWKTWVIASGREHGVAPPPAAQETAAEAAWLKELMSEQHPWIEEQVKYWDAGPPSYRWMNLIAQRQSAGQPIGAYFVRAYAYAAIAMHDATVAAWQAKRDYQRARPSATDAGIHPKVAAPAGSSYPSDYAATAAAAATVMAYLVPAEAGYFQRLAEEAGRSRLYAGVEYPSDYMAGMELGRRVAEQVIARARMDGSDVAWAGSIPGGRCKWTGTNPGNASAASWRPLLLASPSEYRPAPPPDCESPEMMADLAAVRNYPRALTTQNLGTNARAMYWQTPEGVYPWVYLQMGRWILEDKMDAPHAARAYALVSATGYDAFIASQDGKFAYWYARPAQLDSSIVPLFPAPNFPSYPSNHSTLSASRAEVLAHLFPQRAGAIQSLGKEAGDSRIWAGIHFEIDNQAGVTLGKAVAAKFIAWAGQEEKQ